MTNEDISQNPEKLRALALERGKRIEALTNENAKLYGWLNDCEQRAAGKAGTGEKPMSEMTAHELTVAMTRKHTPNRDALEALEEQARRFEDLAREERTQEAADALRWAAKQVRIEARALSEPAVPEAVVRIAREALSCCGCSPAERDSGHKIGCPVPQLQDELDRALAQHSEPENGDDS